MPDFAPITIELRDGRRVTLRSVRPADREELQAAIRRLSPEARYARFMTPLQELSPQTLDQAVNPAVERELQLVAVCDADEGRKIAAGARYSAAPGSSTCEFAVAVTEDWQRAGLARQLLLALMRAAHERGFRHMEGYVLATNNRMLRLAQGLGFVRIPEDGDPTVCRIRLDLAGGAAN